MCEYRGGKPPCVMKVNVFFMRTEVGFLFRMHYRPTMILRVKGLSVSIYVGTRKMVNYA